MHGLMKLFLSLVIVATVIAPVYAALGDQKIVKDYTAAKGWTSIVPMTVDRSAAGDDLISYNTKTGHTIVSVGECIFGPH